MQLYSNSIAGTNLFRQASIRKALGNWPENGNCSMRSVDAIATAVPRRLPAFQLRRWRLSVVARERLTLRHDRLRPRRDSPGADTQAWGGNARHNPPLNSSPRSGATMRGDRNAGSAIDGAKSPIMTRLFVVSVPQILRLESTRSTHTRSSSSNCDRLQRVWNASRRSWTGNRVEYRAVRPQSLSRVWLDATDYFS